MTDARDEILRVFAQEASDQLEALQGTLLDLEEDPDSRPLLRQFMRTTHTLKGSAGVAGLVATSDLTHAVESVMQCLWEGQLNASAEIFDRLSQALDLLGRGLPGIAAGGEEHRELDEMRLTLEQWLRDLGAAPEEEIHAPRESEEFVLGEYDAVRIGVLLDEGKRLCRVALPVDGESPDTGAWVARVLRVMRKAGSVVATSPPAPDIDRIRKATELLVLLGTDRPAARVLEIVEAGLELSARIDDYRPATQDVAPHARQKLPRAIVSERTVRVEMRVLDELLRLAGELMISRDRFARTAREISLHLGDRTLGAETDHSAAQLANLTSDLQDAIMQARMVPVARIFRAIKRRLRRVARQEGRAVLFESTGEQTELDKSLADALIDPVASFAERLASTQALPAEGAPMGIAIAAERRWNQVVLTLTTPTGTASKEEEALLALEGAISLVGGRLDRREADGDRMAIVISLPLTLVIIRVMMTLVGGELFAFPIEAVRETLGLDAAETEQIKGTRVVELRGVALSLLFLGEVLDVPGKDVQGGGHVLVVGDEDVRVGVVVDRLLGIRDVVIKSLSSRFSHISAISGSVISGDEQIALIVDAEALLREAMQHAAGGQVMSASRASTADRRQTA